MRPAEPPASLLLVHGAGSGPWVFVDWHSSFPNLKLTAVDLQEGLAVEHASHADYATRVVAITGDSSSIDASARRSRPGSGYPAPPVEAEASPRSSQSVAAPVPGVLLSSSMWRSVIDIAVGLTPPLPVS